MGKMATTVNEETLLGLLALEKHGLVTIVNGNNVLSATTGCLDGFDIDETKTTSNSNDSAHDDDEEQRKLISFWTSTSSKIQFDEEGYVTFLDLGGKRLHRGFPCPVEDVFGNNYFQRLTTLNIAGTDLPLPDIMAILNHIQGSIQTLFVGGNGIGSNGGAKAVGEWISLNSARNLIKLDLRYNDIDNDGMTDLCDGIKKSSRRTIEYLYLEGNIIGDDGAKALSELLTTTETSLREIYMGANRIQASGAQHLTSAFKSMETNQVSKLYLEGNNIGEAGAAAFSAVLEESNGESSLKKLYVDNNNIGKEGSNRLAKALKSDTIIGDSLE